MVNGGFGEKKNDLCNFKLFILSLLPVNYPATVIVLCLNTYSNSG